jgi:hypothetical protein
MKDEDTCEKKLHGIFYNQKPNGRAQVPILRLKQSKINAAIEETWYAGPLEERGSIALQEELGEDVKFQRSVLK